MQVIQETEKQYRKMATQQFFPDLDIIFNLSQPSCIMFDPKGEKEPEPKLLKYSRETIERKYIPSDEKVSCVPLL